MKRVPTVVFSEWAESGRDVPMAKGHERAVANMLKFALKGRSNYSFIDAGCGNGWVVRKVKTLPGCVTAIGLDGAPKMIEKATDIDPEGTYLKVDLESWTPQKKVDIVLSMEVIYYLNDPKSFINNVCQNWLNENGRLIVGLDFYKENPSSHSWPEDCGISLMQLFNEDEWVSFFNYAGFKCVQHWRVDAINDWGGTLILTGVK